MSMFVIDAGPGIAAATAGRHLAPSDYPPSLERIFELFVTNPDLQLKVGWQDTAMSWFIAVLAVGVAAALALVAIQWWRIRVQHGIPARVNSVKRQTKFLSLPVIVLAVTALIAIRFASDDYLYFINVPGLLNSMAICILAFVVVALVGHYGVLRFAK